MASLEGGESALRYDDGLVSLSSYCTLDWAPCRLINLVLLVTGESLSCPQVVGR